MWVIFFSIFFNKKIWPNFPKKKEKITQICTRQKKGGRISEKIPNFFVQKMTKFVNNKLLAHITNSILWHFHCFLIPPLLFLIHKVIKKKGGGDQKGKTWHENVVAVICQSTKIKQKKWGWRGGGCELRTTNSSCHCCLQTKH